MHMKVLQAGALTTIQDRGRVGYLEYGIGASGVMDDLAYNQLNELLENDPAEAVLEMTLFGARLQFDEDVLIAYTVNTYRQDRLSASKLVGAEGGKMETFLQNGKQLCGTFMGEAMVTALKMAESNACMRRIVAAPTAGSCGVIPAVLIPYYRLKKVEKEEILKALFVTAGIGEVISQRASISGAQGGCQAEIGSASAMAAGALVFLQGGSDEQICHAAALALKGLLGLVCDPVAGLVEVPCVKRNVLGCVNAISCADMAMAGIESRIPPDEVIDAMQEIGSKMDASLRETALGGLAATKSGCEIASKIMGD